MKDTTVKKVSSQYSPKGEMGQKYLVNGVNLSMRLWEVSEQNDGDRKPRTREYETVGYMVKGKAELHLEGQKIILETGDSWLVPKGVSHYYNILEPIKAIEATSPPAEIHERDEKP